MGDEFDPPHALPAVATILLENARACGLKRRRKGFGCLIGSWQVPMAASLGVPTLESDLSDSQHGHGHHQLEQLKRGHMRAVAA
jgi:hypothetical protein